MSKKLITVFGATGNQGGSVISLWASSKALQSKYAIRAVTRDTSKPSAKALAEKGAEVVSADLDDESSLKHAVQGAHGVFALTNYWEYKQKDKEFAQGKAIADASIAAGVKHFVWSSLPHTTKLTDGKLAQIDHFVAKAEVEEYIEKQKSSSNMLASYYMPAMFMSNYKGPGMINPGPDGTPTIAGPFSPSTNLPLIDIQAETGSYVWGALEAGSEADGARIQAVSEWITQENLVEVLSASSGSGPVKFAQVPREVYKGFLVAAMGEYIGEEMTQNMELIGDYSYYGKGADQKQQDSDRFLYKDAPKKTTFEQFVVDNKPWAYGSGGK